MRKLGYWLALVLIYIAIFFVANSKFWPTPEMLKVRVKGWTSVVVKEDVNLNNVIVEYCKNYHKVDFVSLRDLIVIENPNIRYNVRKGDVLKIPLIR